MKKLILPLNFIILISFTKGNFYDDAICQNQFNLFSEALSKRDFWALELFDTWAKIQAGLLSGNPINIGDFDSCVKFRYDTKSDGIFQGQHCQVNLQAMPTSTLENKEDLFDWREFANFLRTNSLSLTNGFCLPASCPPQKVVKFLNEEFLNKNDISAVSAQCKTNDPLEIKLITFIGIIVFGIFLLILIGSTSYDLYMQKSNRTPHKFWSSHSIYTNGMKLFDMTKIKSPSAINCMHGLRVLSIFWIIIGHRVYNNFYWGNFNQEQKFIHSMNATIIETHHIAVDTFLVIAAVLVTMATLRDCDKGQLSIGRMIWRRYLRYTPAIAALMLFYVSFTKFFVVGPHSRLEAVDNCKKSWWIVLLHFLNFIPFDDMCLSHLWYISVDFQLFIISPFLIYLIHKQGRKFLALPAVLLVFTIVYIISITAALGIDIKMPLRAAQPNYVKWIYFPTQSRAGPWFIGMILGYFMHHNRGKVFKISRTWNAILWIGNLSLQTTILYVSHYFTIIDDIPQLSNSILLGFHRNLWALTICWIIFACQHLKTGGIIRWFLSLPQWQPIGRMGLSMYILHPVYQYVHLRNQRVPIFMGFWQLVPLYLSDIVMTIFLSTIWYLAFEAPPLILEEYFYNKFGSHKPVKNGSLKSPQNNESPEIITNGIKPEKLYS